jgi:hypothetical protein
MRFDSVIAASCFCGWGTDEARCVAEVGRKDAVAEGDLTDVEFASIVEVADVGCGFVTDCGGDVEANSVKPVNLRIAAVGSGSFERRWSPEELLLGGALTIDEFAVVALTDGELTDGELTDGELTDGELTDGELTDGELTDGELTDGELTDGELTDGELFAGASRDFEANAGAREDSVDIVELVATTGFKIELSSAVTRANSSARRSLPASSAKSLARRSQRIASAFSPVCQSANPVSIASRTSSVSSSFTEGNAIVEDVIGAVRPSVNSWACKRPLSWMLKKIAS